MWEYKIVNLSENEFKEIKQKIDLIKNKVNADFKEENPNWQEERENLTESDIEEFLNKNFYGLIRDCINNIYPYYRKESNNFSFNPIDYFEYKMNEYGGKGWRLDKIRLMSYTTYTNGILIFRKKI